MSKNKGEKPLFSPAFVCSPTREPLVVELFNSYNDLSSRIAGIYAVFNNPYVTDTLKEDCLQKINNAIPVLENTLERLR